MKFTEQEMVFLNSVSGGGMLYGLPLHFNRGTEKTTPEEVMQSLVEKGMLAPEERKGTGEAAAGRRLTEKGGYYAFLLKQYRKASRHIVFNYLHAAIMTRDSAVMILPIRGGYDLYSVPTAVLAAVLLQRCPADAGEQEKEKTDEGQGHRESRDEAVPEEMRESMSMDQMLKEIYGAGDAVTFGCFSGEKTELEKVYYRMEDGLYAYDLMKQQRIKTGAADIRREVAGVILPWRRGNQ